MTAPSLTILRGLPGSGKSTYARAWVAAAPLGERVRVNRDDLRVSMFGPGYAEPIPACELQVTSVQYGTVASLLGGGVDVIVDDTNLRARTVRDLARLAVKAGATWRVLDWFLDVPVEVCIMRDKLRDRPVGEDVIWRMHRKYLAGGRPPIPDLGDVPVAGAPYRPDPTLPRAVMVDIDGTVALHEGVRGPYDTSRYHLDRPNAAVVDAIHNEMWSGERIVFCSGRDEDHRAVTEAWLRKHVTFPEYATNWELFMRPAGDRRNDAIIKLELFDKHIRHRYNVLRVYDDRARVVAAWRSIGLTVFAVADGNF